MPRQVKLKKHCKNLFRAHQTRQSGQHQISN